MEFTVKSKKLNKDITFSRPGKSYIYVDINGGEGTLGLQICKGTVCIAYSGDDQLEFNKICRNWYRKYIKNI